MRKAILRLLIGFIVLTILYFTMVGVGLLFMEYPNLPIRIFGLGILGLFIFLVYRIGKIFI